MRIDYMLYVIAAVFFVITAISFAVLLEATNRSLWVVSTVVLGLLSIGLGYNQRPKIKATISPITTPVVETQVPEPTTIAESTQPVQQQMADTAKIEAPLEEKIEASIEQTAVTETQPFIETPVLTQTAPTLELPSVAEVTPEVTPVQMEEKAVPVSLTNELTQVKGIGEKRAVQLNNIGINSIYELSTASTEELANKLKVSPRIVEKWITGAKELAK